MFQGHGDSDPLVPHQWGKLTADVVKQMSTKHTFKTYPGMNHQSCPEVWKQFSKILLNPLSLKKKEFMQAVLLF